MNQLNIHVIPGNRDITVNRGTRLIDAIEQASVPQTNENGYRWVAARVGNVYTSLLEPLKVSCTVECLTRENTEGMRIYRKTLIFLFEMASRRLFPDKSLIIGHALGHGFYHRFKDNAYTGTEEDAEKLQANCQTSGRTESERSACLALRRGYYFAALSPGAQHRSGRCFCR